MNAKGVQCAKGTARHSINYYKSHRAIEADNICNDWINN
jgi:hypothetical protein